MRDSGAAGRRFVEQGNRRRTTCQPVYDQEPPGPDLRQIAGSQPHSRGDGVCEANLEAEMKLSTEQTASVESAILKQVRAHPGISRVALARHLKIAASTVGTYV